MADGINRVTLLGGLCADPELRSTTGGQAVLKIRLATNESYLDKNRQRQERTDYHSIVVWGRRAEALSRILNKGSRILVEGAIRTSSYNDRDGNKRYKTEIIAQNIILCGGRSEGQRNEAPPASDYSPDDATPGDAGDDSQFPF